MKDQQVVFLVGVAASLASAQTSPTGDVGSGAPTDSVRRRFVSAWFRNGFSNLVASPPLADVKKFGTTGLVQEFSDAAKTSGVKLALIAPNSGNQPGDGSDVFQLLSPMYVYYSGVGVTTAGYPTGDTTACPSSTAYPCQYQLFDKKYALFAYLQATPNGQTFAVRDPFYTKWSGLGGINVLGAGYSAEASVTSPFGSVATAQSYAQGIILNITTGTLNGRLVSVRQPIYWVYSQNNGPTGFLGFPTGYEVLLPTGNSRQTFEGGSIAYGPNTSPFLRLPVGSVSLPFGGTSINLNLDDTYSFQATVYGDNGQLFTDRAVNYLTSNSRVIAIETSGNSATARAVGGGSARVTATSEGKTTAAITFFVTAPCCGIGEGAPTDAIQTQFQDAVSRNRLAVKLPAANPVVPT